MEPETADCRIDRWKRTRPSDYVEVSEVQAGASDALLALYDQTLPQVYGYLLSRCQARPVAEDLTTETYLAAVDALRRPHPPTVGLPWLIGAARHKLADHWRRQAREQRGLQALGSTLVPDPGPERLDAIDAQAALTRIAPQYRCALVLRYVDDLPVAQVAELLGRSVDATEAVLSRAKAAFRDAYPNDPAEEVVDHD
jgi:RNA polymerase sigma-70 factor (ECF subfamily)